MDSYSQLRERNAACVSEEVSLIWRIQIYGLLFMNIVLLNGSCCLHVNVSQLEDLK